MIDVLKQSNYQLYLSLVMAAIYGYVYIFIYIRDIIRQKLWKEWWSLYYYLKDIFHIEDSFYWELSCNYSYV